MPRFKIPEITVERLSIYLRAIKKFDDDAILSSQRLAELVGTSDGQVRKDLAYFGEFGVPGQGYKAGKLKEEISRILGLDRNPGIALVGVGRLGSALLAYPGFNSKEFKIKAAFDNDPSKVGRTWQGITIQDVQKIPEVISREKIDLGIITTPAPAAQEVASKLIEGGVKGILNFSPTRIVVPDHVKLKNVDLAIQLEGLSYFLTHAGL